jgi:hypothetical protein
MREVKKSDLTFDEANAMLDEYNRSLRNNFVGIGYTLKRVREDKLFLEAGYKNFDEFMNAKYGKDKSWASKCISIAVQFGQGEETPVIQDKYADYEFNKLVELVTMTEEPGDTENVSQGTAGNETGSKEKSCDGRNSEARAGEAVSLRNSHKSISGR